MQISIFANVPASDRQVTPSTRGQAITLDECVIRDLLGTLILLVKLYETTSFLIAEQKYFRGRGLG